MVKSPGMAKLMRRHIAKKYLETTSGKIQLTRITFLIRK
jgi:hypothetical protein